MTFFHVWKNGDSLPTVITDNATLQSFLSTLSGTVVVNRYDAATMYTTVYGAPGGIALPKLSGTAPTFNPVAILHIPSAGGGVF